MDVSTIIKENKEGAVLGSIGDAIAFLENGKVAEETVDTEVLQGELIE